MSKNLLFFLSTGIVTPLYLLSLARSGNLSLVLGIDLVIGGVLSLYLGKLSDKTGVRKLFLATIPLAILSVLLVDYLPFQILYGVSLSTIGLFVNIQTSKRDGNVGKNFGTLTFYTQIATAFSILLGGILPTDIVSYIYAGLMMAFLILNLPKERGNTL